MKMLLKKETKRTVVYETDDLEAPVSQVYVSKLWLSRQEKGKTFPLEIDLEIKVPE